MVLSNQNEKSFIVIYIHNTLNQNYGHEFKTRSDLMNGNNENGKIFFGHLHCKLVMKGIQNARYQPDSNALNILRVTEIEAIH